MRFRGTLVGIALCVMSHAGFAQQVGAQPATVQDGRLIQLGYEISFAGLPGFRMDVTARLDGQNYDIESHTYKEGLIRALTIHYVGRNRAWGRLLPGGAQPSGGSLSLAVGDKVRTWLAQYGAGGQLNEQHQPEWKPAPEHRITDEQRLGSLDPLTASLSAGFSGTAACDKPVPSFDGKRRIDIVLQKVGMEPAAAIGPVGGQTMQGEALVCQFYTKRVAGEFYDAPKEAETEQQRPMKIWFVSLDNSPVLFPVKLEAQTGFGTIRGKTVSFTQRPLTDQEKAAIRR
jgi:hypothetical protein